MQMGAIYDSDANIWQIQLFMQCDTQKRPLTTRAALE